MNRRGLIALGTSLLVAGCNSSSPGASLFGKSLPTYRYRLTVEVDTPEGLKTGSSVIEVSTSLSGTLTLPEANKIGGGLKGEAVAVDLPGGQTLFALLRSVDSVDWARGPLPTSVPPEPPGSPYYATNANPSGQFEHNHARMLTFKGVYPLPRWVSRAGTRVDAYPMLVRFGDIGDPRTVQAVDPDRIDTAFGKGVRLKRITVQQTTDPVTTGIEKRLRWLNHLKDYLTDPDNPFSSTLPSEIGGLRSK